MPICAHVLPICAPCPDPLCPCPDPLCPCPQCPDSACKQDLLAYLQRIALYCHQLNICSKVKAEVQNLGGELVVSGVSTAPSCLPRQLCSHNEQNSEGALC